MLITDNTEGQSDGRERDTLQGMVAVGSEFMTFDDGESTVQRSSAFARYERKHEESTVARYVLLHELSQVYTAEGVLLGDDEYRSLNADTPMGKRLRGFLAEMADGQSERFKPMEQISGYSRIPRFNFTHYYSGGDPAAGPRRKYYDLVAQNYTAQGGKRRLFSLGDGRLALIRERFSAADGRYFYGTRKDASGPYTKARGVRVSTVDLALIDASTGAAKQVLMSFDVRSGTGVEIPDRVIDTSPRYTLGMIDASCVYGVYSGALWGRSLTGPDDAGYPPVGGDPGDTYAIAQPAWVEKPGVPGAAWLSLVAVYPAADDAYNSETSGVYRLTCKRTLPDGGTATSKITIPVPSDARNYLAPFGMVILRLTPTRIVLRMSVQAMQLGAGGAFDASANLRMYFWSDDNGATWTHNWTGSGFPIEHHYGGDMVLDSETVLAFSRDNQFAGQSISVYNVKATGTSLRSSIQANVYSAGLLAPLYGSTYATPYMTVGFGGVVYLGAGDTKTKRIWMQLDPIWTHKASESFVLDYPGSRPMLVVSDDGGLTWQRRLLPTKWAHLAGFVVATGPGTLAVPVLSQRQSKDAAPAVTLYESRNGGDSWSATAYKATLPASTWADGQIVYGAQIGTGASQRFEQDVKDAPIEYNRGELLPLIALRDEDGRLLAGDPSRPWITDFRKATPSYG